MSSLKMTLSKAAAHSQILALEGTRGCTAGSHEGEIIPHCPAARNDLKIQVKSMHQLLCGYNLQKVIHISIALGRDLSFPC